MEEILDLFKEIQYLVEIIHIFHYWEKLRGTQHSPESIIDKIANLLFVSLNELLDQTEFVVEMMSKIRRLTAVSRDFVCELKF